MSYCTGSGGTGECNTVYSPCEPGDKPDIAGRLTAISAFPNSQVVIKPCLSAFCSKRDSKVDGRVCNLITPVDGQQCGEAGDYMITHSVQLPGGDGSITSTGMGWIFDSLTIKIQVQKETGCESSEGRLWSNTPYQYPYPMMGVGILAGLVVALCRSPPCREKKKRRSGVSRNTNYAHEMEDDDTYCSEGSYIEMGSTTSSVETGSIASSVDSGSTRSDVPPELNLHRVPSQSSTISSISKSLFSKFSATKPPLHPNSRNHNSPTPNTSQDSVRNSRPPHLPPGELLNASHQPPHNQVPLEVLRQWYEKHGIAIV